MHAEKKSEQVSSKSGAPPEKETVRSEPARENEINPAWNALATNSTSGKSLGGAGEPPPFQRQAVNEEDGATSDSNIIMRMAMGGSPPTEPLDDEQIPNLQRLSAEPYQLQRMCADCEEEIQRQPVEGEEDQRSVVVQPQLKIGAPDDEYEREADQVADQVMRMPLCGEIGEEPQKSIVSTIQTKSKEQKKLPVTYSVQNVVSSPGAGSPVSKSIRSFVEPLLGVDLSAVSVHSDSASHKAAEDINARAFTHQNHVYLGPNESYDDLGLMAHELTHTVQQGTAKTPSLQRFEARHHESAERVGLSNGAGGLNQEEVTQIYMGNWMRDVNQAFVPTMQRAIPNQVRFALLKYMGVKKFGQSFSAEQLGFYIPAEHIDNPGGLLQPGGFTGDTLPSQPAVVGGQSIDAIADSGLGANATPQESVHPSANVSADIDANIFSVDQSAVMAFMRRTNQHIERRLKLASQTGRTPEGMMHFGAALHAIEDLFAHSNWIEIAANKVLADSPWLISDLLQGEDREIFTMSGRLEQGPYRETMITESRPILTTGSFVALDTAVSVSHEMISFLRTGLHAEENPDVGEAQKELMLAFLGQYGGENVAQYVAILQSVPFPSIPPEVLNWAYGIINPQLVAFAEQMEAQMAEQRISETNLAAAREANQGNLRGEFSALSEQMMALEERFGAPPVADQKRLKIAEATEREASFAATPEQVMAGPSHSQIAKDHSNSVFFGIAFRMAAMAVSLMRTKMVDVWNARGESTSFTRDRPAMAHPNEAGWPWQEGYVPPWRRGRGPTPRTSRNFSNDLDNRVRESLETGEYIINHGHAEGQNYSIEEMRNQSIDHVQGVSDNLTFVGRLLLTPLWSRNIGRELLSLAVEISAVAELINDTESFEQRDSANRRLMELQALLGEQVELYMEGSGSSVDFKAATLGAAMTIMNREVAATAVAYTLRQRRILSNNESPLEVSNIDLGEPDLTAFENSSVRAAVRGLIMQSRDILGHPYDDLWWYEEVYSYIESNAEQFAEEVRARNAGWAGFRHDRHGH